MSAANPIVSILTSTDEIKNGGAYTNSFLPALNNGLPAQVTVKQPISAKGDYDTDSSANILNVAKTLDNASDLIVALGGLVTAEAVAKLKKSAFPNAGFMIIVGNTPKHNSALEGKDPNNVHLLGGVDIESAIQNSARADALMQKFPATITDRSNICLYYNKNSHMFKEELTEWKFHIGKLVLESTVNQKNYNRNAFATDLGNLPSGTQGVVVSSDPFFGSKANELAAAANARQIPVCYPTDLFATASNSIIFGASINAAYQALGNKANLFLKQLMAGTAKDYYGIDIQAPGAAISDTQGEDEC